MRRGELFKLRWSDVDFIKGLIFIRATNTKTQTERVVGMTPDVQRELQQLWEVAPDISPYP
jgi:integrase